MTGSPSSRGSREKHRDNILGDWSYIHMGKCIIVCYLCYLSYLSGSRPATAGRPAFDFR
jgi:hypothetical protein